MGVPPTLDDVMTAGSGEMSAPTPAPQVIAGRYEIMGLLGVGGMGTVYRARDRDLDETVALKVLRKDLAAAPGMLERFRREVKLARRVTHKNVARVYDIGEQAGDVFLTMEYVDGEALSVQIGRGAFDVARAVDVASAICAGLSAAHAAGVIHRDLKPDNVLVAKDGRILVTDFGIARTSYDTGAPSATVGMIVGTPTYMAPEQLEGLPDIDARVDVYAFGAMLYEIVCGEAPWLGPSPIAIASARLYGPPPDPRAKRPDLPDQLARLILRCMARNRDERYATVERIATELAGATLPAPIGRAAHGTVQVAVPIEEPPEKSIAVLPFRNAGPPGDEYLADGLTEDLIDTLSMTRGLRVRSRSSVMALKGLNEDPRELGRKLNVQVVVEGSVRKIGSALRVSARLVSVADGFQLWARRFDRSEADVLAVNDETARAIAEALTLHVNESRREVPTDPMAIDLYLRARQEYRRFDPESVARAVAMFEKALNLAPDNPTILSAYAVALGRHWFYQGGAAGAGAGDLARQSAERAIRAAPHMGEPRLALGWIMFHIGDAAGAVREIKTAILRAPALAEAHEMLARILSEIGLTKEANAGFEKALALDPYLHFSHLEIARELAFDAQWDDVDTIIDRISVSAPVMIAIFYRIRMSMWQGKRTLPQKYIDLIDKGEGTNPMIQVFTKCYMAASLDAALIEELHKATDIGGRRYRIYGGQLGAELAQYVGHKDIAISEIRRSVNHGLIDVRWMDRCPMLEGLRGTPEFDELRAIVAERAASIVQAYRET